MFNRFYPDEWVNSTYDIDFEKMYRRGFRGVIFDIDNTLVPHGAPADDRAEALFKRLREIGINSVLLSNNDHDRVDMFNKNIGTNVICKASKPSKKGYRKAMEIMGTTELNTFTVGDQLFTDMWGASNAGLYCILVKPIHPKEEIQIILKRRLEAVVLFFYKRKVRREEKRKEKRKQQ
ncbi:MAG: YqeG family HAD IIIA-type phosphatase [Lachnospiraceae bacterium]|nr:YqeG family HAD IIIA-type phosphatase [Lachnospiraceae bacterium]